MLLSSVMFCFLLVPVAGMRYHEKCLYRERGPKTVGQMTHYWPAWSTDYPYVMFALIASLPRTDITIMVVGIYLNIYNEPATMLNPLINI